LCLWLWLWLWLWLCLWLWLWLWSKRALCVEVFFQALWCDLGRRRAESYTILKGVRKSYSTPQP